MSWFIVAILAYLILAVVFLVDKYLLVGPIPNPKIYAFYVGLLGLTAILIIPFIGFYLPQPQEAFLAFISGAAFVYGIFWFFKGLKIFESSRVVPAVGAILPIFTYLLILIFSGGRETLTLSGYLAFVLLIFGSFLITFERAKKFSLKSFKISIVAAFLFALSFALAKYVYLNHPFLVGLVWIRVGGAFIAISFLLDPELRKRLFSEKIGLGKKTTAIFLSSQAAGAGANILQNWAIALAPLIYVAFINALQGVQYVFLLIFTTFLSIKLSHILKEEISKVIIFQKITAILLIGGGLALLALK